MRPAEWMSANGASVTAARVMKGLFEKSKGLSFCANTVTITSALNAASEAQLAALADELTQG